MLNIIEQEYLTLLNNKSNKMNKYELFELIDNMQMHNLNINTLSIQADRNGTFSCRVDEPTKAYYSKRC